jgi:hypothetical protein
VSCLDDGDSRYGSEENEIQIKLFYGGKPIKTIKIEIKKHPRQEQNCYLIKSMGTSNDSVNLIKKAWLAGLLGMELQGENLIRVQSCQ